MDIATRFYVNYFSTGLLLHTTGFLEDEQKEQAVPYDMEKNIATLL